MRKEDIKLSIKVITLVDFNDVPKGTIGVIDELYDGGFMVAWDKPDKPLPKGYKVHDGQPMIKTGILRDGFSYDEVNYLQIRW